MRITKRLNYRNIFIAIAILVITIFSLIKVTSIVMKSFKQDDPASKELKNSILTTDKAEENKNIVKDVFADGMNLSDFLDTINREDNYIKSTHEYRKMSYNFERNLKYSEVEEYLNNLNSSNIVKLEVIGLSHDERKIYNLEIGNGTKTIMFDANIHAAEIAGTYFLLKYANDLVDKYENGDKDTLELLSEYKIAILPSINPDGFDMTQFGVESIKNKDLWVYEHEQEIDFSQIKSNANGVDLNRNLPTQNAGLYYEQYNLISSVSLEKKYIKYKYFGGKSMGSEPETKALIYFFSKHYKNTYSYVNLHSAGRVIYVGKPNLSDEYNELCKSQGEIIKRNTNYILYTLDYEEVGQGNDGTASDFMAELAHDFRFSTATKRLSKGNYNEKSLDIKYKYCATVLETLGNYSQDIDVIKSEWIYRNMKSMFDDLVKQNE